MTFTYSSPRGAMPSQIHSTARSYGTSGARSVRGAFTSNSRRRSRPSQRARTRQ